MGAEAAVAVTEEGSRLERLYVRHVPRVTRIADVASLVQGRDGYPRR